MKFKVFCYINTKKAISKLDHLKKGALLKITF